MDDGTIKLGRELTLWDIEDDDPKLANQIIAALVIMGIGVGEHHIPGENIAAVINEHGLRKMSPRRMRKYLHRMQTKD